MKGTNRRVGKPQIPVELIEEAGIDVDGERAPAAATREKPPSRVAAILRTALGVALVVGVSVTAALGARRYVTTTHRFAVSEIVVSGNARRTEADIANEAGIAVGANVFSLDLDRARARLLADPWIREATLSRRLPGTVNVQVVERDAAAIVAIADTYLASRDGDIFKRIEPGDPTDLPAVTGLTADSVAEDRDGAVKRVKRALDLAAEYEHSPLAARAPLEEVHLAADGGFTLFVGKSAIALQLGDAPFHRKLEEASRVLAELDRRGAKADAVMLDNDAHPERVVARVR